jgi:anthranilate synthase/aminodeoxychorismate synthase-like glutamine amidotransferase
LLPPEVEHIVVRRNDRINVDESVADPGIWGVIISPGPMTPAETGVSTQILVGLACRGVPVLGICLGHQCIAAAFGATVARHPVPTHGKSSQVALSSDPLFDGLPNVITAGRYHSLHVVDDNLERCNLRVIARVVDDGTVMGLRHRGLPVVGVQFHPESILTGEPGRHMLGNFVSIVRAARSGSSQPSAVPV